MKSRKSMDLTTGPIMSKLLPFVMPIMLSNLLQHMYNAADRAVVGQFSGSGALAAVGASGPAITLIVNLFVGLSVGTNIICSNLRGAKKETELKRFMHTAVVTSVLVGLLVCLLGQVLATTILTLMDTPAAVMDMAVLYMRIYMCGIPASLVFNFGSGMLRAHGDTRRPMLIMMVSGAVNVVLNLVFVVCFHMDVDGVALATAISHYLSAGSVLFILFRPSGEFGLQLRKLKAVWSDVVQIVKVGVPCSLNSVVFSLSNVIIQSSVNSLGEVVLAGNSAAAGLVGMIYQVIVAFYSGCISFAGQCYGAKKYRRIDRVLGCSLTACVSMLLGVCIIFTLFPKQLLALFNPDPEVIAAGIPKLMIDTWAYLLYCVTEIVLGGLRGMKRTTVPMVLSIATICVPRVVWVLLIYPMLTPGIMTLFLCYPISYVISLVALTSYYIVVRRKLNQQGDEVYES